MKIPAQAGAHSSAAAGLDGWVPAFAGISKRWRDLTVISAERADGAAVAEVQPLLAVNNIEVIYTHVILVLKGVSLAVPERGIVALLGANGAGKTTSLKAISNLLRAERGEVTKGSISFAGARIDRLDASDVVRRGLIQVMDGRHCFERQSQSIVRGAGASTANARATATRCFIPPESS